MFVVNSEALPRSFELFDYDRDTYYLRFTDAMDGRIQLSGSRVVDFSTIKKELEITRRGDAYAVYGAAAAERAFLDRTAVTAELSRAGVDVVDARPEDLPPRLADRYLALKAAGRL